MVDSRAKGARAETVVRDTLKKYTGLAFERTPSSGALDARYGLKGDIYVPKEKNLYTIEVKHYEGDHVSSKVLTDSNPQLIKFWEQAVREASENNNKPLLIFKFDRSKLFVAFNDTIPNEQYKYLFISVNNHTFYISLLEDWLYHHNPKFIV